MGFLGQRHGAAKFAHYYVRVPSKQGILLAHPACTTVACMDRCT